MALPLFIEGYWIRVLSSIFMYAIITGALNIIAGFAGYAAFGNIVFFGIGAYTTAMLMLRVGFPWWLGVIVGAVLAAIFAILAGLPILRLRGHYFAIATLGINRTVEQIALDWGSFTGGGKGITLPLPANGDPQFLWHDLFHHVRTPAAYYSDKLPDRPWTVGVCPPGHTRQ